jgi:hypothetical protein
MGYTHTFAYKKEPSPEQWAQLTTAFKKVVENLPPASETAGGYYPGWPIDLQVEYDEAEPIIVDDELIKFNGAWDYGHETFWMPRALPDDERPYLFCKTNRKPYDFAVCAVLILTEKYAPGCYEIGSDGDADDWMPALTHLQRILEMPDLTLPAAIGPADPQTKESEGEKQILVFPDVPAWF